MSQVQPTQDEARATLLREVYQPVFFQKLAEQFGEIPATEEDANHLLKIAADLADARARGQHKEAAVRSSFYADAAAGLSEIVGTPPVADARIKQAATLLAQRADVRAAALAYAG